MQITAIDRERLEQLFARQRKSFTMARNETLAKRLERIRKLRDTVRARQQDIRDAGWKDFRKPPAEVDLTEIFPVLIEANQALRKLRSWTRQRKVRPTLALLGTRSHIVYEPKGVVLVISPWNFPLNLSFGPLISALAAGNRVILKPSEITPAFAQVMNAIINDVFPPDEVAVVEGGADVSQALLKMPFDHIFFTGSSTVGREVMKAAVENLSPVTLELGGKSPVIVDRSANIHRAVDNIVWGKFVNAGQTCIAPDHVYVHSDIARAFGEALISKVVKIYGNTLNEAVQNPDYSGIVDAKHSQRLSAMLADARSAGARVLTGGEADMEARVVQPTVLGNVTSQSRLMQEEIFGPLLPLVEFSDIDQPIAEINQRAKPLAIYIFSKNKANIGKIIKNTSAGGTCINHTLVHFLHAGLPFGGIGESGYGRAHGYAGFTTFSNQRTILEDRYSLTHLAFPPYTRRVQKLISIMLRYFS